MGTSENLTLEYCVLKRSRRVGIEIFSAQSRQVGTERTLARFRAPNLNQVSGRLQQPKHKRTHNPDTSGLNGPRRIRADCLR